MAQQDPLVSAFFALEFQGAIVGAFQECTGLGSENEVVEYKASTPTGGYVLKYVPGRMKYNKIVLKRGITAQMDLWTWRAQVEAGQVDAARKNGSVVMFKPDMTPVAQWDFTDAWPSKLTGPTADAKTSQPGIEEIEIVFESYKRIK